MALILHFFVSNDVNDGDMLFENVKLFTDFGYYT